jgi:hypothetical protein
MYKIEKGIEPVNPNGGKLGKPRIYPFDKMEIGDSFFVESNNVNQTRNSLGACCYNYVKRNDPEKKFMVRKVEGGVRVWRIK